MSLASDNFRNTLIDYAQTLTGQEIPPIPLINHIAEIPDWSRDTPRPTLAGGYKALIGPKTLRPALIGQEMALG